MPAMLLKLWQLLVAFGRVGIVGYGGGPSMIPLVEYEVVNNYGWMTQQDFSQILAVGYALPGPIATKMAGYVGYKVAGWAGAGAALLGVVAPTVLVMTGLFVFLTRFKDAPVVAGVTRGVEPVVAVLLAVLVYDVAAGIVRAGGGLPVAGILIAGGSLLALQWLRIHPALVMAAAILIGAFFLRPA